MRRNEAKVQRRRYVRGSCVIARSLRSSKSLLRFVSRPTISCRRTRRLFYFSRLRISCLAREKERHSYARNEGKSFRCHRLSCSWSWLSGGNFLAFPKQDNDTCQNMTRFLCFAKSCKAYSDASHTYVACEGRRCFLRETWREELSSAIISFHKW